MMTHLEDAKTLLEQANTSFVKHLEEVDIQHKSDKEQEKVAHIITYFRMAYAILHEMEE